MMRRARTGGWIAAVIAAAFATRRPAGAAPASTGNPFARCIQVKADEDDFSGVIVAVHRDEPVVSIARGVLAGDGSPLITATTRFNIASAGKMFTAVAVAQLVDGGKVDFGDAIGKYVSGLRPATATITVRQLLNHTSGLGNYFSPQNMKALREARTASDLLPLVAEETPAFQPGTRFQYSNSGYALLGVLIERVSGETYDAYLRRHVFLTADMRHTGLDPRPFDTLATGMTRATPGSRPGEPLNGPLHPAAASALFGSPAGGAFSTAPDLQKFAASVIANRLTSAASTAALTSPQSGTEAGYGYGFAIRVSQGRKWIGHNGGTLGVNAEIRMIPGEWCVVVLSNRDPPSATKMFEFIEELIAQPARTAICTSR